MLPPGWACCKIIGNHLTSVRLCVSSMLHCSLWAQVRCRNWGLSAWSRVPEECALPAEFPNRGQLSIRNLRVDKAFNGGFCAKFDVTNPGWWMVKDYVVELNINPWCGSLQKYGNSLAQLSADKQRGTCLACSCLLCWYDQRRFGGQTRCACHYTLVAGRAMHHTPLLSIPGCGSSQELLLNMCLHMKGP